MRLLTCLLNRLASDTAARAGAAVGVLAFHLGIRREVVRRQLDTCLGLRGRDRARVARRAYATVFANFLEVWTIGGPDGLEHHAAFLNPMWLEHLHRQHGGLVFVTSHLGNWEAASLGVRRHMARVLVYAKEQNTLIDPLLNERRTATGVEVLLARRGDRTSAVQVLRALRDGAAVGLLADQRPHVNEAVPGTFLGQAAWCHAGPAFFARKLGVPVVPGFSIRRRAGQNVLFIGRPVLLDGLDDAAATARVMGLLSAGIAAFPGQYFWHHHRFRKVPPMAPPTGDGWRRGLRHLVALALFIGAAGAVEDPLATASVAVPPAGSVDLRLGAAGWKDERNWTLGGHRDTYQGPIVSFRGSPGEGVSLDASWPIWVGMVRDEVRGTHGDFGDVTLGTTWRALGRSDEGFVGGLRWAVSLPQTDYGDGLGTDTTRWTGLLLGGYAVGPTRLDAQAGFSIQPVPDPASTKGQNDLIAWGLALSHRLPSGPVLLAEVTGLDGPQVAGAGPHGEARAGFRLPLAASVTLDAAARRGMTGNDGSFGAILGLTWSLR